jgi:hypothetical protein
VRRCKHPKVPHSGQTIRNKNQTAISNRKRPKDPKTPVKANAEPEQRKRAPEPEEQEEDRGSQAQTQPVSRRRSRPRNENKSPRKIELDKREAMTKALSKEIATKATPYLRRKNECSSVINELAGMAYNQKHTGEPFDMTEMQELAGCMAWSHRWESSGQTKPQILADIARNAIISTWEKELEKNRIMEKKRKRQSIAQIEAIKKRKEQAKKEREMATPTEEHTCQMCNHKCPSDSNFCPKCGAPKKAKRSGSEVDKQMRALLAPAQPSEERKKTNRQQEKEKHLREKLVKQKADKERAARERNPRPRTATTTEKRMQLEIDPEATADAELLTNRRKRITLCDDPYAMQGGLDMNLRKDYLRNHEEIRAIMAQANTNWPAHEPFAHVTVNRRQAKEDTEDIQVTMDMNICMTIVSLRGHIKIHTREPRRTIADIKAGETWTLPTTKEGSWGGTNTDQRRLGKRSLD